MSQPAEAPEIGRDALDPVEPAPAIAWWTRLFPARRAALGLRASAAPSLTFILIGMAAGPQSLGLLPPNLLELLDPVVSVALAALGVFVGLGLAAPRDTGVGRLLVAAVLEVALTMAAVTGVLHLLLQRWAVPLPMDALPLAATLGLCASASAATRVRGSSRAARVSRIVDLDDVPLVLVGAIVVAMAAGRPTLNSVALSAGASAMAALAGWLLFERAHSDAERGVFVAGVLMLVGGVCAYAGASPLLGGALAAILWVRLPGGADHIIRTDLRKLQHPLVALLLIVAGATIQWSTALAWIAAPLVLLRLIGKLLASLAVARLANVPPALMATVLLHPGVLGIALALNVYQVLGDRGTLLLSSVTVAAAVSELLVAFLLPGQTEDAE